jgi:hypothetical protein
LYVTLSDSKTVGYAYTCITDISVAFDGSVWALSCDRQVGTGTQGSTGFKVIKYNPPTNTWYEIPGIGGLAIAAFNEISASVVTSAGSIFISSASA